MMAQIPRRDEKLPWPRAVIFDWDNTLIDSWPPLIAAVNATLTDMGHDSWSDSEAKLRIRASLRDSFPIIFGDQWERARDIFYDHFARTHLQNLAVKPFAREILANLSQWPALFLGVVSNKQGNYLREECRALGWDAYFRKVVGATDAAHDKPHPVVIDLVLSASELKPGPDVWLVGDTAMDILCAHNAGCTGILVGPAHPGENFTAAPPAWHCLDLHEFWQGLLAMRGAGGL
ncbi:MAG: HAD family hydrolase [Candidatus Symbiobacter sp.]|nr:HAD family hydrolase [Candidatus Symbiobacter sp.]